MVEYTQPQYHFKGAKGQFRDREEDDDDDDASSKSPDRKSSTPSRKSSGPSRKSSGNSSLQDKANRSAGSRKSSSNPSTGNAPGATTTPRGSPPAPSNFRNVTPSRSGATENSRRATDFIDLEDDNLHPGPSRDPSRSRSREPPTQGLPAGTTPPPRNQSAAASNPRPLQTLQELLADAPNPGSRQIIQEAIADFGSRPQRGLGNWRPAASGAPSQQPVAGGAGAIGQAVQDAAVAALPAPPTGNAPTKEASSGPKKTVQGISKAKSKTKAWTNTTTTATTAAAVAAAAAAGPSTFPRPPPPRRTRAPRRNQAQMARDRGRVPADAPARSTRAALAARQVPTTGTRHGYDQLEALEARTRTRNRVARGRKGKGKGKA
ncbi:hypothetical protein ACLMJK_000893 [Lecanora helva]